MKHSHILFNAGVLSFLAYIILVPSCGKYEFLDKPPGADMTEDTVFNTVKDFEKYLAGTYLYGLHSIYPMNSIPNPSLCMTAPITDEGESSESWQSSQVWNSGSVQKNDIIGKEDGRFTYRFKAIRRCNIIIERMPQTNFTTEQKNSFTAEALFIRALNNFEMFKRYGAMPIVDKRLTETDEWRIPRATLEEFVSFMVEDCTEAARLLEGITRTQAETGRITREVALALKSRILLYAASPLFNTDTPYMETGHPELVCFGTYDAQRWNDAAKAAQEALDAAIAAGHDLYVTGNPETDYRDMWSVFDNKEILLTQNSSSSLGHWDYPWKLIIPGNLGMSTWGNAICVPHNFIRKYEKMDGTPQTWNAPGVKGDDIMEKYAELDPRFRQTVAYNGSPWNQFYTELQYYEGGQTPNSNSNVTGAQMHKLIPYTLGEGGNSSRRAPNGILFRVGELYLNLAEALNEYSGPTPEVYDAVNAVRMRAGMPALPEGLDKDAMRKRIKNERDIELAFEDHRLWDIRRWMDAEQDGVMQGDFYKVTLTRVSGHGLDQKCDYVISRFETRTFHRKMYLHPIQESEVNKGYLTQNPGW